MAMGRGRAAGFHEWAVTYVAAEGNPVRFWSPMPELDWRVYSPSFGTWTGRLDAVHPVNSFSFPPPLSRLSLARSELSPLTHRRSCSSPPPSLRRSLSQAW